MPNPEPLVAAYVCVLLLAATAERSWAPVQQLDLSAGDVAEDLVQNRFQPLFVLLTAALATIGPLELLYGPGLLPRTGQTVAFGVLCVAAGLGLRLWTIRTLGPWFTYTLGLRSGQVLVTEGPFKWVRHPSYLGGLLLLCGAQLIVCSLPGLLVAAVGLGIYYRHRIEQEESMLVRRFGDAYRRLQVSTWKVLPLVW